MVVVEVTYCCNVCHSNLVYVLNFVGARKYDREVLLAYIIRGFHSTVNPIGNMPGVSEVRAYSVYVIGRLLS